MTTRARIAALLLAGLALTVLSVAAQESSVTEAAEDSGPITRRPPPRPDGDRPGDEERAPRPQDSGPAAGPAVVEVLDASGFGGVFAAYTVRDGREIPEPLTGEPGDPVSGRRLFHNASRTGCSLCHGTAEAPRAPGSDRTAPPLHRAGERLSPARIRLWVVAPETIRPGTEMPAFHKPGQRADLTAPLYGGPRLTAQEVEDVVAYVSRAGMPEKGGRGRAPPGDLPGK